ncbi:MAG: isoprenylcysteine carboxylmethyltransferase family protein [Acidobacteria bacterium]|nr:isoprenylcysteine carboxylmethyltransferase family protein [Acidobacteriota bacterium]
MTTLFWVVVLGSLLPCFLRRPETNPSKTFAAWDRRVVVIRLAAWDRRVVVIRLAEFVVIVLFLGTVYLWHWSFPITRFEREAAAAGWVLTMVGLVFIVWSRIELGRFFSITLGVKRDHQVITGGPYCWVRHPMYTGFLALLAGGALVHNSGTALLFLAAPFWGFFYWQSVVEEKLLVDQLGEAYLRYRARTGCLLPRLFA